MGLSLIAKDFLSYGVRAFRDKVVVAFLLAAGPVAAEPATVLALGDSLTQGFGLPEWEGFVPQLEDWLEEQGREVDVVNGGVSGDTTAGGAARVEWSLTPKVDAMIVALGGNDLLRGIAPEVARGNLAAILAAAQEKDVAVLLVGMSAPGNYGPEYKQEFDAIYPDLAEQYNTLYFKDFFAGLGEDDPAAAQRFFQSDGIHPNAEGVDRIVEAMGPAVVDLIERER
jgi:acyl-CoA thioesterase-1